MSVLDFLPVIITVAGLFLLIKLRFFFILKPIKVAGEFFSRMKNPSASKSLALALAGTLGVGNIVGVAHGIIIGGAGSLFWLLISGVFASVIKYAECTIAADKNAGAFGMAKVIKLSCGNFGGTLGIIYAALLVLLSLGMGSALQSNSSSVSLSQAFNIDTKIISAVFALLVSLVIIGGAKRIENATAIIIPIATLVYIFVSLSVIVSRIEFLPEVVTDIINNAFAFKSVAGGVSTFIISNSIREGFARGILSNEAGAGTSAAAQTRGNFTSAASVGLFGIAEVFFDTTLLCSLTGVMILSAIPEPSLYSNGMILVIDAVSTLFGNCAPILISALIFAFAFSTVICWYYYGSSALGFVFGSSKHPIYTALFIISTLIGGFLSSSFFITASDYILFFMSLISLFAVLKNSERILFLSEQYGLIKLKNSDVGKRGVSRIFNLFKDN